MKLAAARTPDTRRRLRVLMFGIALTLVPLTSLDIIAKILHVSEGSLPAWLLVPVVPLVLVFPLTIAYVTVVQRALDVGVVVRQSLQYALARRGVWALQIAVSMFVVLASAAIVPSFSFAWRLLAFAFGIAVVLLTGLAAKRLGSWIDRRFFREAYNADQILHRLADNVNSMVELQPLLRTVAGGIDDALHVANITVFLNEQDEYRPAWNLAGDALRQSFPVNAATVRELARRKQPLEVDPGDSRSWAGRVNGPEAETLRELRAQLLLPLSHRDRLLGFMSLGPKQSEAPYSPSDVNLLQAVASQTALAVENSRLTSTIASETAQREVIERELAIAREVQQRLFPQTCPAIPGLEYYGTCRPAREVGGDYYDFLALPNRNLGIAIGDVSGKGVPASLLMASLQASLRGQTMAGAAKLDQLLTNMNRLIYDTTPVNRYATFFYAQYDSAARRLDYVNAGHNAPFVLRGSPASAEYLRLETGGPPIGLLPQADYMAGSIDLRAGDLFILFTDGVSEAMNAAEEEWGEPRLLDALAASTPRCPAEIVRALFSAADKFAAGAPQHDDMTLVVFHVRAEQDG